MRYRICKSFEIEAGHMLSKHSQRCRHPHGHTRRIEFVLSSDQLDANDMVCDFQAIKLAVADLLDHYDHAMAVNSEDPFAQTLKEAGHRVVEFDGTDPTTEVLARAIYQHIAPLVQAGAEFTSDENTHAFRFPHGITVERVRVWETSTSWAEYGR